MQRGMARRIAKLAEAVLPLSAAVFVARVRTHARQKRMDYWAAFDAMVRTVSDDELERLAAEFERIAFGDDIAARDAAKLEVFAAAGIPDWNPRAEERNDEGW